MKSTDPKLSDLFRVAAAAKKLKLIRTTLLAAVGRGEIPTYATGCQLKLVTLSDGRRWAKQERFPGRKPSSP